MTQDCPCYAKLPQTTKEVVEGAGHIYDCGTEFAYRGEVTYARQKQQEQRQYCAIVGQCLHPDKA